MIYYANVLLLLILFTSPAIETIQFKSNDVTLEGDLVLPKGDDRVPLVVFVHGSGQRERHDYDYISKKLNEAGYATFQYDKRGVGKSGGSFLEVGTLNSDKRIHLLASDCANAVKALANHKRIDKKRITIMGGSQAGWIIPVVTSLVEVRSTVCISGPTVSVGEEIYYSELAEFDNKHSQDEADKLLKNFKGPHGFDNIRHVSRMKHSSLWIFGGKDVSIPVKKCIARLDSVKVATKLPIDMKIYSNADHGIYDQDSHKMEDYATVVIQWLKAH